MPQRATKSGAHAGISRDEVDALAARLEEELRLAGPRHVAGARASSVRLNARAAADRLARVTADRPLGGRAGVVGALQRPVKLAVRKLARWYVEPVFADQRAFNDALLKLVDDLYDQIDRLERELDEARATRQP
jgi:hypothetical protein